MKNNQYTATPNWFKDTTTSLTGSLVGLQVTNYYIQGGSSSGGGTIDMSQVWEALAADTTEQINKSHLTDALKDIGLEGDFVDLTSDQNITGIKNFINGLKISDKLINIVDGVLYLDCNVAVTGGLTVYAQGTQDIPSIWDGAPFDNVTIHYNEETGLIEVIGGTGGGVSNWEDLQGKPEWLTDTAPNNDIFPNTANYWVTDNDKILSWDNAASKAHEHANKATLDKIYEKDGVIYWDGSLAVTGGITSYALGDVAVSTIMDGVVVDGTTIAKVDGVLKVLNAGGGEAGSVAWENVTNKPSWIGITKPSYNWSEIGSKPTTLGGYGITDAYTKTESDNRFVNVSGDTMTGTLTINSGVSYGLIINRDIDSLTYYQIGGIFKGSVGYEETVGINLYNTACKKSFGIRDNGGIYFDGNNVWHAGNDGTGSGLDADLLDGLHQSSFFVTNRSSLEQSTIDNFTNRESGTYIVSGAGSSGLLTVFKSGASTSALELYTWYNWSIAKIRMTIDSNRYSEWKDLAFLDSNVASATKLQTARTIWGQGFDGTANISGSLFDVININASGEIKTTNANAFRAAYNDYGFFIRNDGEYVYFMLTNKGDAYGSYSSLRPIIIHNETGDVTIAYSLYTKHDGNIGIGTYSPSQKLDVNGTARANSLASTNIRIECDNNGVLGSRTSEINNYNSSLYLQYDSATNLVCCIGGGNVGIGATSPSYKLDVNGDIHANGWLRTTGNNGWYSETYDGGWYMIDPTYVRSYNGKKVYSGGGYLAPYGGSMWISMATRTDIIDGDQNQSSDSAHALYRVKSSGGHAVVFGGLGNTVGFYGFYKSRIDSNENGTDWSTTWDATNGTITHRGNFLATGGITCYSSDQRAKTVIEQISLSLKQIADAPIIRFKWNDWKIKDDGKTHIGGIAQYTQMLLPEAVLEADNALNMDYATTGYIFAVQTARHLQTYETRTDKELRRLKKRVSYLEKQLKQLGYEEGGLEK